MNEKFYFDKLQANLFVYQNTDSNRWTDAFTVVNACSSSWSGAAGAGGSNYQVQYNNNNTLTGSNTFYYNPTLSATCIGYSNVNTGKYGVLIATISANNNSCNSAIIGGVNNTISVSGDYYAGVPDSNLILGGFSNRISISGYTNVIVGATCTNVSESSGSVIVGTGDNSNVSVSRSKNAAMLGRLNQTSISDSLNAVIIQGCCANICCSENVVSIGEGVCLCDTKNSYVLGGGNVNYGPNVIRGANGYKVYNSGIGNARAGYICATTKNVSGSYIAGGIFNNIFNSNNAAVLGGANSNIVNSDNSVIVMGWFANICDSTNSVLGGGTGGFILNSRNSVIGAGSDGANTICGSSDSFIGTGSSNFLSGNCSFIGVGNSNCLNANHAAIIAGCCNLTCYNNTFLLGSFLSASKPDYTYVNNLSSQCVLTTQELFFNSLSAGSAVCATATQTCQYVSINVAGSALYLPLYKV